MNTLVDKYNSRKGLEFELRVHDLNKAQFAEVAARLAEQAPPQLTTTINVINSPPPSSGFRSSSAARERRGNRIIEIHYVDGERTETTYVEKARLATLKQAGYVASVSSETPISTATPTEESFVRIKARLSYKIGDWRYDLTCVRGAKFGEIAKSLKMIQQRIFVKGLTPANFFTKMDFGEIDKYEFEVEYVGTMRLNESAILKIAESLPGLIDPSFMSRKAYSDAVYEIAQHVAPERASTFKNRGIKALGNQVIALTKTTYYSEVFPPVGFFVTEKADGVRCIIYIKGANCKILTSKGIEMEFTNQSIDPSNNEVTIAEGELVNDEMIYLFDCLVDRDENLVESDFSARLAAMRDVEGLIRGYLEEGAKSGNKRIGVKAKNFTKINSTEDIEGPIRSIHDAKYDYEIDGLIFVEDGRSYSATRNYKWKPSELNTVDFLAVKAHPTLVGTAPYIEKKNHTLYILMCGINRDMFAKLGIPKIQGWSEMLSAASIEPTEAYFPLQFVSSSAPFTYIYNHPLSKGDINGKIVELRWVSDKASPDKSSSDKASSDKGGHWDFLRVREDRAAEVGYYGNNYNVAEITFSNYVDPFPLEALWQKSGSYFTKVASTMYWAPNKYKRVVIDKILKGSFAGSKFIMDIAAGRGADLARLQALGVDSALFMDIDSTAIAELIRRRFEFVGSRSLSKGGMNIMTMVADLKTDAATLEKNINDKFNVVPGSANGIICNFAIHYMCDTLDHMRNLLKFVIDMLAPGGVFMFTTMNGAKIFDLLAEGKGEWEIKEGDVRKYAIKAKYEGRTLSPAGQTISVLLPLADEMKDEPLANIDVIIKEAERMGLAVEINSPFDMDLSGASNGSDPKTQKIIDGLTDDDRNFISLHQIVTLRKVDKNKL